MLRINFHGMIGWSTAGSLDKPPGSDFSLRKDLLAAAIQSGIAVHNLESRRRCSFGLRLNGSSYTKDFGVIFTMKKKSMKKRKVPIEAPRMKSRRRARLVTTLFHRLTTELDEVKSNEILSQHEKKEKMMALEKAIDDMGGRQMYQEASVLSTKLFKTSRWVFQLLTKFDLRPKKGQTSLEVLEVGAINTQLLSCPWLNVNAIDLNSRHEKIKQCDFFSISPKQEYDVVVSSMVINCIPDALERGKMLTMCRDHLRMNGHLFLMLPLLCLQYSNHITYEDFSSMLENIGFTIRETKNSPKIAFFCLQRAELPQEKMNLSAAKTRPHLKHDPKKNSFSVKI